MVRVCGRLLFLSGLMLPAALNCTVVTVAAEELAHLGSLRPEGAYFVSALHGNDSAAGGSGSPFRTLTRCAVAMAAQASSSANASSSCEVDAGTYREAVTLAAGTRVSFHAAAHTTGSRPVLSGLDVLGGHLHWQRRNTSAATSSNACIFAAQIPLGTPTFQQLFYEGQLMVEARWPDLTVRDLPQQLLDRRTWQRSANGSRYGRIVSPALARANFSWDGALATLQVAHEYFTWTRAVANHTAGTDSFEYTQDLPGLGGWATQEPWQDWGQNKFFLSGKLEALDSPGEWFLDASAQLYFFLPAGAQRCQPPFGLFEYKARDYVLTGASEGNEAVSVSLRGLTMHGATFSFPSCRGCVFEDLHISFPSFNREVLETLPPPRRGTTVRTAVIGNGSSIENVSISMASGPGLALIGNNNTVRNTLIEYTNWWGMSYYPLQMHGNHNLLLHSTVRHFGGAGVVTTIPNSPPNSSHQLLPQPMADRNLRVAFTHIHHGGLIAKDSAALYSSGWETAGGEYPITFVYHCSC